MNEWSEGAPLPLPDALTVETYPQYIRHLQQQPPALQRACYRYLARTDLYFLLRYLIGRRDVEHPWLFARCREVSRAPDGWLDLWPRGHYKSTIVTFGLTLQTILGSHGEAPLPCYDGREMTVAIFSHTRPAAKAFLRQIKREFEVNQALKALFPDVLWTRPDLESPRWSEESGLVVRRNTNPKEATVEAWGLVDGQPTGKHWSVLVADDVVTQASVSTPEQMAKTTQAWEMALNLGDRAPRIRGIGTRYHYADTYRDILQRGTLTLRCHPGTEDGTLHGRPVFLSQEEWDRKVQQMGPYTASSQLLLDPVADSRQTFARSWLEHRYQAMPSWQSLNRALLVDPAHAKKRGSDYTAIAVVGYGADGNLYVLDLLRDRLQLDERAHAVMALHRQWAPQRVGYERYGMQADTDYLRIVQDRENYRFGVDELGGTLSKIDRVNRLIPWAASGRLWLPETCLRTDYEGRTQDLVRVLIEEELLPWPVPVHDDMVDAIARVFDLEGFSWPRQARGPDETPQRYGMRSRASRASWLAG
jgi:predicted phage terminase large subunit-like protein